MGKFIDNYVKASGADAGVKRNFVQLVSAMPKLSTDLREAAIQVKEALYNDGFSYDHEKFTAQDVLDSKSGNCAGLPLLVATILGERGHAPKFQTIVAPEDNTHESEQSKFDAIQAIMDYENPELATEQEVARMYRFFPVEHLVLDDGKGQERGSLIEITSPSHTVPQHASRRNLSFMQALSYIYNNRACKVDDDGEQKQAEKLALQGLKLWPENRTLLAYLSGHYNDRGNQEKAAEFRKAYAKTLSRGMRTDPLNTFQNFILTGNSEELRDSLRKYPTNAAAIAHRAKRTKGTRDAKFDYALASQMYANSMVLNLRDFYTQHKDDLVRLFGSPTVKKAFRGFIEKEKSK